MCALIPKQKYTVIADDLELPKGSEFNVKARPLKQGDLCLFELRGHRILGRYFGDAGQCDLIVQPLRWIRISNPAEVRILGAVV